MPANYTEIEKRLWEAADELRANSKLKPSEYSVPVLGVAERKEAEDFDFAERLEELNEELEILNVEARELKERIAENVEQILNL
jgi:hypothetical protein